MKYTDIKQEVENRYSELFKDCGVFWAFSREQFEEGKTPLQEGEKYVSIGAGGYMPKHNHEKLSEGMKEIDAWQKEAMKSAKAEEAILYELNNHEAFYTGTIEDAMAVLGDLGYTEDQVKAVYHKHQKTVYIN
jgi:hypothetical protein